MSFRYRNNKAMNLIKNRKISIVIPVYNTGVFLKECVESIFNQTFINWELICVDDCSDDYLTKEVLLSIEKNKEYDTTVIYNNVKIGASEARNIGIDVAIGEYIIFLDSDDFFAPNFLELMYEKIVMENADVCVTGCVHFYTSNHEYSLAAENKMVRDINSYRESENYLTMVGCAPWNKLVKLDFLKKNNIRFQNISCCNDVYYSLMVILLTTNVAAIPESRLIWVRRNREGQISANRNSSDLIKAIEMVRNDYQYKIIRSKITENQIANLLIYSGIYNISNCKSDEDNRSLYDYVKEKINSVVFCSDKTDGLSKMWNVSDDYHWIGFAGEFEKQLYYSTAKLTETIKLNRRVFLWGYGKRGRAFEKWSYENNIAIEAICDIDTQKFRNISEYGNSFINPCKLLNVDSGIIVASNRQVYNSIYEKCKTLVINLEDYCPL